MGPSPYPASACCPTAKDGPSTLGLRQQRKISTTPVPCAPHQKVSVKGLEHHRLHEGSVHRKRQESEKNLAPQPTQPRRRNHKMGAGSIFPDAEGQAVSKATPCSIPKENWRTAADCRKHRCMVCSSSSHISGGHLGHGPNQQKRAAP